MNFSIETAITMVRDNYGPLDGPPVSGYFQTNNVVDFSDYLNRAIEYYRAMVQFPLNEEDAVKCVSMLVRTYRDHHTVHIDLLDGQVRIRSNQ